MAEDFAPIPAVDTVLGTLCLLSLLLGTPANIISFLYFRHQTPCTALSTLYSIIAATDTWISLNGYPNALLLLTGRDPGLFGDYTFRQLWGLTWEPLPFFSVFLVLVISLMRTVKIVKPTHHVRVKTVLVLISTYALFLVVRLLVGFIFFGRYDLNKEHPEYPYIQITDATYTAFDLYLSLISLAFPVIPIIVSATISMTMLIISKRSVASTRRSDHIKNHATVTVLIFTLVYVSCNIPVFLCYLRYAVWKLSGWDLDIFKGPSVFLDRYIWIITYITQLQLNSFLNPCVYFLRMRRFRRYLKEQIVGVVSVLRRIRGNCLIVINHQISGLPGNSGGVIPNHSPSSNAITQSAGDVIQYCGETIPSFVDSELMVSTKNAAWFLARHWLNFSISSSGLSPNLLLSPIM